MLDPEWYEGREQTYIKHFVLRRYLRKLAYKFGYYGGVLNYVDCFAGPWMQADEELRDTSPFIAVDELRQAREGLKARGRPPLKLRCLFIESRRDSWRLLNEKLQDVDDVEVKAIQGEFERSIESIHHFVTPRSSSKRGLSFFFVDPTGWTGYPFDTIAPLFRYQRCEVLINFMTQFVNRFIDVDLPEHRESFRRLFGSDSQDLRRHWAGLEGPDREDAIVRAYCQRIRDGSQFKFVTYTPILEPRANRTNFHLIYATRRIEGLRVFRNDAERPAEEEQETKRRKPDVDPQQRLFPALFAPAPTYSEELRARYHEEARAGLRSLLKRKPRISFDEIEAELLLFPLTSTRHVKDWLSDLRSRDVIEIEGLSPRGRVPQSGQGHLILVRDRSLL